MTPAHLQRGYSAGRRPIGTELPLAPSVYSVREAADALRVSRSILYELISAGRLRSIKQGSRRFISARAIDDYVASLEGRPNRTQSCAPAGYQDHRHPRRGGSA